MPALTSFQKILKQGMKLGKVKIGFGLARPDVDVLKSLRRSKKYADIVLVGPRRIKNVKGFKKIVSKEPEQELAELLVNQKVDGIVRGTIDDFKTLEAYEDLVGKDKTKNMLEIALLEDAYGRQFFISEASNPMGWTRKEKVDRLKAIIEFVKKEMGIKPKVGLITAVRHETYKRRKKEKKWPLRYLNETYKDAEYLVKYFKKKGINIKNYAIELNTAVEEGCNIIVPPNGMVGNQIFRSLCLIGGGKILICTRANLPHPYEDNSRNEKEFEIHTQWLAAWINRKKFGKQKIKI